MSHTKARIAILLFAVAVGLMIYWAAMGHNVFTSTEHMVQVKDELFGTTTEKWVKAFTPGLDIVGPIAALFIGTGAWLLRTAKRKLRLA